MSKDSSADVPAGWYPSPDGKRRYWDGESWLALPDPTVAPGGEAAEPEPEGVKNRPKKKLLIAAAVAVVVLGAVVGGLLKVSHDSDVRSENEAAAATSSQQARESADRQEAAAATSAARESAVASERALREAAVDQIESGITTMAEGHVASGIFDGPILSVSCDPVGGGSTDDLSARTTIFECFAATRDNGDGTLSGRKYHATMNWDTDSFTYGLGAP